MYFTRWLLSWEILEHKFPQQARWKFPQHLTWKLPFKQLFVFWGGIMPRLAKKLRNAKTWGQREVTKFNWCNPAKTQWINYPTSKAKPKKHKYIKKNPIEKKTILNLVCAHMSLFYPHLNSRMWIYSIFFVFVLFFLQVSKSKLQSNLLPEIVMHKGKREGGERECKLQNSKQDMSRRSNISFSWVWLYSISCQESDLMMLIRICSCPSFMEHRNFW